MIKIFTKDDWIPPFADGVVFTFAPAIVMATILLALRSCRLRRASASRATGTSASSFVLGMTSLAVTR